MKEDRAKPVAPEATSYDCDVFISYSSKDKAWVRGELLNRIEDAGLRAFIDFRDFTRGALSISEMERGVAESRKTLLILTPDYIKSGFAKIESIMLATLDPANDDLRTLPLLKTPCDKPLRIAAITHIDFTDGADHDLAWRQLLTALGAAPEPPQVEQPTHEQWFLVHPYAMPPNFTGRVAERAMLTDWLARDATHPLLVLRALGGFGKSALTWHWLLHDVDPARWPRVVWWSFYESDASFESFVATALHYLSSRRIDTASMPSRAQLEMLLRLLRSAGILLILDGFERGLRAFGGLNAAYQGDETLNIDAGERDCLSRMAEVFLRNVASLPGMNGKILLTTRLRPAPVETRGAILLQGCREEDLVQLQPGDAVAFFHAQGIRGGRAEIEAACTPYGYHPLSLRLLCGLLIGDFQQPGDIAAAQRLDVNGDLVQRQHHVLDQAFRSLGSVRQKLLSRIACFRGPVSYDALKALAETELPDSDDLGIGESVQRTAKDSLDSDLRDLIVRGLLHRDLEMNRFDLHPIVRRYAYDCLAAPDRVGAHALLRHYFDAVPAPDKVRTLDDLAPVIELYHHTVRSGQFDEARTLFRDRLSNATYYQLGAYQLRIELLEALFPEGDRTPRLKEKGAQAWTQNALANSYSLCGQPRQAVLLLECSIAIREKLGDAVSIAIGLVNAAGNQARIGALRTAEDGLRRSISLCREIEDEFHQGMGHQELGWLLAYRGAWFESIAEFDAALKNVAWKESLQCHGINYAYRALCELLRLRYLTWNVSLKSDVADLKSAIAPARRALELADEDAQMTYPVERDYIQAHWLMGAAYLAAGELDGAENHLEEALERCRRINNVEIEADILLDLARLRIDTAEPAEAQRLAEEALDITERSGYVLQGADAHLVLAKLAKDRGDLKELREHATEALRLATCDGPPDYTYKAAYDEATALLR
ncbi:MAG TPA: TIR domain-containing protein [Thermoanaerobaculia bacterium]|jgi:tetratricopeptide (TPR) repeat protein|nr:TIR domain-containing protein [Thermoanaerobaculia bacterium]